MYYSIHFCITVYTPKCNTYTVIHCIKMSIFRVLCILLCINNLSLEYGTEIGYYISMTDSKCTKPQCLNYTPPNPSTCDLCGEPIYIVMTRIEFINELLIVTGWHWEHESDAGANENYSSVDFESYSNNG